MQARYVHLTPLQSCQLHGWTSPRRILTWEDLCKNPVLTIAKCVECGLSAETLRDLQPDVYMWIMHKGVSFSDVEQMLPWPLHPVYHLNGNISDLASMRYKPTVLRRLGITYEMLRSELQMDDAWMKIMPYTLQDWAEIGFTRAHVNEMSRGRIFAVFGTDVDTVLMRISGGEAIFASNNLVRRAVK
jgi:hypothetical protein